ncbi:MAG: hypothetical protein WBV55_02810 [Candidatus Sulfotelmatobacter sp.]
MKTLLVLLLLSPNLLAQDRKIDWKIDPTWLHRYVPHVNETQADHEQLRAVIGVVSQMLLRRYLDAYPEFRPASSR